MGFPYPHHDAEFLRGVAGIALVAAIVFPIALSLPTWAGIPLASLPMVQLIA